MENPPLLPLSLPSSPLLHLTPQCFRIKMTTRFQKTHTYTHTHTPTHTHTSGISLGSVRGCYRPYFITDFTHVSNHKIRVSHFSDQTQTSPLHPSPPVCPALCPEPNPFLWLLNLLPYTLHKLSGPRATPSTHTHTHTHTCAYTQPQFPPHQIRETAN